MFLDFNNSMNFVRAKFFFSLEIFIFCKKLFGTMTCSQNVFRSIKMIKSLTKTFLRTYYNEFLTIQHFLWKLSKSIFTMCGFLQVKFFLGWVLMVRKVLPSKSMNSGDYFEYISYAHISNRSQDMTSFTQNYTPLVSYN